MQQSAYLLCTGAHFFNVGGFSDLSNQVSPVHSLLYKFWRVFPSCITLLLTFSLTFSVSSQPIKQLDIGSEVQNVSIGDIINYNTSSSNLLSFNNKLLILDFFATWCTSCIRQLPKLDCLQKQFPRLQVVLVTHEPKEKLDDFRKKNKLFAASTLPIIYSDTIFRKLFPHTSLPHQVWLAGGRKVLAITYHDYLTVGNLTSYFATGKIKLPLKNDDITFNTRLPLLQNGNGGNESSLLFRSLFAAHLPGAPSGGGFTLNADSTIRRIYHINRPVLSLYASALANSFGNRIVLEVRDSSKYIIDQTPWHQWALQNTWCYELTLPASSPRSVFNNIMLQDLNRYLGLHGRMELRDVPCWVLVCKNQSKPIQMSKGGQQKTIFSDSEPLQQMHNAPLSSLVNALNSQAYGKLLKPIIIDETGFHATLDMQLNAPLTDLPALKKELNKYGFDLQPACRKLSVFVLSETNSQE